MTAIGLIPSVPPNPATNVPESAPAVPSVASRAIGGIRSIIGYVPAVVQYTYAGLTSNTEKSKTLYEASASQGHPGAHFALAQQFEKIGLLKEAFNSYKEAAELGHVEALYKVGEFYENEKGVKKDRITACAYYHRAAALGHAEAMFRLGEFYSKGVNAIKAFQNYKKAADLFHAGAQYKTAQCYELGIGVDKKDPVQAFYYYYKAANQKHVEASFKTAECYELGNGTTASPRYAFKFYQFAAERDHAGALHKVGDFYLNGTYVYADPVEALKAYEKAAGLGNRASQNLLQQLQSCLDQATILEGVNASLAFVYFLNKANQGDANGQFAAACCYALGKGTPLDERKAAIFCIKAVGQEHARANVCLAEMYEHGKGVKKNREKASFCYQKALFLGLGDAELEASIKARLAVVVQEITIEIQNDLL